MRRDEIVFWREEKAAELKNKMTQLDKNSKNYERTVRRLKRQASCEFLEEIFIKAYQKGDGGDISVKDVSKATGWTEKITRSRIQNFRKKILEEKGMLLFNSSICKYRLGNPQDIPIELVKGILRASWQLMAEQNVIAKTRGDQILLGSLSKNIIESVSVIVKDILLIVNEFNLENYDHPDMKKAMTQLNEIQEKIEETESSSEF